MARPARLGLRVLLALAGLPSLLIGLWALPTTVPEFIRQYRASRWPATPAQIVRADGAEALTKVGSGRWLRRWQLTWEYAVDGRKYSGGAAASRMANDLDPFPPGTIITLNYLPRDPAVAVWHDEDGARASGALVGYGVLLLLGGAATGGAWALGARRV